MYDDFFKLRLSQLRTQKGVSARDMSLSLGQNPGYINNIETGKALPSMSAFFYICEYLNISPNVSLQVICPVSVKRRYFLASGHFGCIT